MSTSTDRVRQYRHRKDEGRMMLGPIEVSKHLLAEMLVECGLLDWDKAENDDAIRYAVALLLTQLIAEHESDRS